MDRSTGEPVNLGRVLRLTILAAIAGCASGARLDPPPALSTSSDAAAPARYSVSQPADLPDELTIPLERRENRLLAAVRIDGRAAGAFVIDTGANAVVVDERLADELALPSVTDGEIGGIHAKATASLRRLQRLSIADLQLDSATTVAVPLDDLSGLIGFPALGPAPFTIDFERARLTVYNPARFQPPARVKRELLRLEGGLPYVEATLADEGQSVWLLLDTGAAASIVLWRPFVQAHPDVLTVPQKSWALSTGAGGGTQVMVSEVRVVRLFGREFSKIVTLVQDPPEWTWHHPRVAGLVGLELLRNFRVTIHPDIRRIWAEPS